jgi:hypothetical protein
VPRPRESRLELSAIRQALAVITLSAAQASASGTARAYQTIVRITG